MNCYHCRNYQTDACTTCLGESNYTDTKRVKKLRNKRKRLQSDLEIIEIGGNDEEC